MIQYYKALDEQTYEVLKNLFLFLTKFDGKDKQVVLTVVYYLLQ